MCMFYHVAVRTSIMRVHEGVGMQMGVIHNHRVDDYQRRAYQHDKQGK